MNPPSSKRTSATSHNGRGAGSTGTRSPCRSNSEGVGNSASKNSLFSLSTRSVAFTFSSFTAMNFVCRRRALFSPLTASASVAISTYVVTARSFSSVKRTLNGKRLCTPPTASAHALYRAKVTRGRRRVTRVYWYCGDENSSVDSSSGTRQSSSARVLLRLRPAHLAHSSFTLSLCRIAASVRTSFSLRIPSWSVSMNFTHSPS